MADEVKDAGQSSPAKKSGRLIPITIVLAIMAAEGVAVYFVARMLGSNPAAAVAAVEAAKAEAETKDGTVELDLAETRPSNSLTGRFITFHVRVSALVKQSQSDEAKALIESNKNRIQDAVNVVFRGAEPAHLKEPGLESIRRRIEHEVERVLGRDDLIQQVLIPQMLQSSPGL